MGSSLNGLLPRPCSYSQSVLLVDPAEQSKLGLYSSQLSVPIRLYRLLTPLPPPPPEPETLSKAQEGSTLQGAEALFQKDGTTGAVRYRSPRVRLETALPPHAFGATDGAADTRAADGAASAVGWDAEAHADPGIAGLGTGRRYSPRQRRFGFGHTLKSKAHDEAMRERQERRSLKLAPSAKEAAKLHRERVYARQRQRLQQQQEGGVRWHRSQRLDDQGARDAVEASQMWHQRSGERQWDRGQRRWKWVDTSGGEE